MGWLNELTKCLGKKGSRQHNFRGFSQAVGEGGAFLGSREIPLRLPSVNLSNKLRI
jgi:hypothetical protein